MGRLLGSFFSCLLLGLGALKLMDAVSLSSSPWGRSALAVGVLEFALGAVTLLRPRSFLAWTSVVVFALGLSAFTIVGPAPPDCACLGLDAHLSLAGRRALALFLLAGSAAVASTLAPATPAHDAA